MEVKKILWLVSWYPNPEDPFDGDFIQRHAEVASLTSQVHVLFVKPLVQVPPQTHRIVQNGMLTEEQIFIAKGHGVLKKLQQQWRWFQQYKMAIERYVQKQGKPHIVHVHIPWKVGLIALWLRYKYGLQYHVTEHWGIYNNVVDDRFLARPFWMRWLINKIFRHATTLTSVSRFLGEQINHYVLPKPFAVIPNVVNTNLFFYNPQPAHLFTFLHVSNMVPLKNVEGILRAFAQLRQSVTNVRLVLIGNRDNTFELMARSLHLGTDAVQFLGEIPHIEVAKNIQAAHCLVLNSHIENAPCVIAEALCCGVPVIATKVGGIPEMLNAKNGILIEPANDQALLNALIAMMERQHLFAGHEIALAAAEVYGQGAISKKFDNLYQSASSKS